MPRKFGQHFLADPNILEQIAWAACPEHCARLVEIGPGKGALTLVLLPRVTELHAIEIDPAMIASLKRACPDLPKLHIHEADVLATDLASWGPAVITGNLPYYITSPIIEKFLRLDDRFPTAVFLMQWEVAERITAQPNCREYGYLSVFCQLICNVELICKVPASAFRPPPQVESAALRFTRRPDLPNNWEAIRELASRAFAQKRKTLRNNLRGFYNGAIERQPEAGLRAEQLSIDQFIDLHRRLSVR